MEAEEFMELFDVCWFGYKTEIPTTAMLMLYKIDNIKYQDKLQFRSSSDRCIGVDMKAGKQLVEKSVNKKQCRRERGRKGVLRRSSSALGIEEMKRFMDLGFVFDEEEDKKAWAVLNNTEKGLLMNSKMPSSKINDIAMKHHLRFWAHIVASNVKY